MSASSNPQRRTTLASQHFAGKSTYTELLLAIADELEQRSPDEAAQRAGLSLPQLVAIVQNPDSLRYALFALRFGATAPPPLGTTRKMVAHAQQLCSHEYDQHDFIDLLQWRDDHDSLADNLVAHA